MTVEHQSSSSTKLVMYNAEKKINYILVLYFYLSLSPSPSAEFGFSLNISPCVGALSPQVSLLD